MTSPVSMPAGHKMVATDFDAYENLTAVWSSFTGSVSLTNITVGNGTFRYDYRRVGKTVDWDFFLILGSTSAIGTSPAFTLPATPNSHLTPTGFTPFPGTGMAVDDSAVVGRVLIPFWNGTGIQIDFMNATPTFTGVNATTPWTWATSDSIHLWGTYQTS